MTNVAVMEIAITAPAFFIFNPRRLPKPSLKAINCEGEEDRRYALGQSENYLITHRYVLRLPCVVLSTQWRPRSQRVGKKWQYSKSTIVLCEGQFAAHKGTLPVFALQQAS